MVAALPLASVPGKSVRRWDVDIPAIARKHFPSHRLDTALSAVSHNSSFKRGRFDRSSPTQAHQSYLKPGEFLILTAATTITYDTIAWRVNLTIMTA